MSARLVLVASLANMGLAGAAAAQSSDATRGLGSLTDENPLADARDVSVRERSRAEWAPEAISIGTLELTPQMAIGAGYDDNLFATRAPRIDDAFARLRPRVSIARAASDLRLTFDANADLTRYLSRPTENITDYGISAGAQAPLSTSTRVALDLTHARLAEERISPDSPTGVIRPNRFTVSQATASIDHGINRLRLRGVVDLEQRDYRDGETPLGSEVDQDFRDRTTATFTGVGEYALSPSIALFGAVSYNQRDYRTRIGPVPARSSEGYEVAAGATFDIGRRMRGSVRAGYLKQNYRDPFFDDLDGLLVRGEVAYFLTPLVTLTGSVDRSVVETGVLGAAGYLRTTATLRADYELLRNVILGAEVEREQRDFNNIEREDDRWTLAATASWLLSRRVALRADVQHRAQASVGDIPGREFEKTRVSVGVTFTGL